MRAQLPPTQCWLLLAPAEIGSRGGTLPKAGLLSRGSRPLSAVDDDFGWWAHSEEFRPSVIETYT